MKNHKWIAMLKSNRLISLVIVIICALFVLVPFFWMLSTSFKTIDETFSAKPSFIPRIFSFEAYKNILLKASFAKYLYNSFIVVLISTLVTISFATLAGYGMSRFKFKGLFAFTTFLLLTQMFPSVLLLVPIFQLLSRIGAINTHLGLIFVYIAFQIPLCTWLMVGFFNSIPKDLDSAAAIDGLAPFSIFIRITLPLSIPGISSTFLYAFFNSWNEYMFAKILIKSPNLTTLSVGIGQLVGQYNIQWNELMASSVIGGIPLFFIFLFFQKYFVSGLTAGAVKQ